MSIVRSPWMKILLAGVVSLALVGAPAAVTAALPPVDPIGQAGGVTNAVLLNGSTLYMSVGPRVMAMNVSDPAHPVMLGQSAVLSDVVRGLAHANNRLYAAADRGGLFILDTSAPASLPILGRFAPASPTNVYGVGVSGSYAYVAAWNRDLRIVNISQANNPAEVGFVDMDPFVLDVVISGTYAYVANEAYGLQILSLTNPVSPTLAGFYKPSGYVWSVAVSGQYAYVAHAWAGFRGLDIVNVSNPASPQKVGSFAGVYGMVWDVTVAGSYAYLVDDQGLKIVDVSSPAAPFLVGQAPTPAAAAGCPAAGIYSNLPCREVAAASSYAYVADDSGGLRIFNTSAPAQPALAAAYTTIGRVSDVATAGGVLYAVDYAGLHAFGPNGAGGLTRVGFLPTRGAAQSLSISGNYAYLLEAERGGSNYWLEAVSIAQPASLRSTGVISTPYGYEVAADGARAYVAASNAGLEILDTSNPASLARLGAFVPPLVDGNTLEVLRVTAAGGQVYAMVGGYLRHIDVSNPAAPFQTSSYLLGTYPMGLAISGNLLYAVYSNYSSSYLDLFSLSNPISPGLTSSLYFSGWPVGLAVDGSQVYVANEQYGLTVVDVSQPATPTVTLERRLPGKLMQTAAGSGLAGGAASDGGLLVFGGSVDTGSVAAITTSGGTFTAPDGQAVANLPSGAFTGTVSLNYRRLFGGDISLPADLSGAGAYFDLTAVYAATGQPAQLAPGRTFTLTVTYDPANLGGLAEADLALYYWDGLAWQREASSAVDPAANTVRATPNHFSVWAVLGKLSRLYLPLISR